MRDLNILKLMMDKDNYYSYRHVIPDVLCKETDIILSDLAEYYNLFPAKSIADNEFIEWFHHIKHSEYEKKQHEQYDIIFRNVGELEQTELADAFVQNLQKQEVLNKIKEADNIHNIHELLASYEQKKKTTEYKFLDMHDLDTILEQTDATGGYKWRLSELNTMLGTLIPGTFGVVAARPDSGKTGFLASEISYIAQQLAPTAVILWLNNEGTVREVAPRIFSALCNATRQELDIYRDKACAEYKERIGNRLKLIDIHGWSYKQIEKLVKDIKPTLVLMDMLDEVKGPKGLDADTSDMQYDRLYHWARNLAVINECIVIGTSQLSADALDTNGYDLPFPSMAALKGSKTSKQGAASWILMMGLQQGNYKSRFLSAPKSKRGDKSMKSEVIFDPEKSLFLSENSKFKLFNE